MKISTLKTKKEPIRHTENLALYQDGDKLEIHLQGATHAVVIGHPKTLEAANRFIDKAEPGAIPNLRAMYRHY